MYRKCTHLWLCMLCTNCRKCCILQVKDLKCVLLLQAWMSPVKKWFRGVHNTVTSWVTSLTDSHRKKWHCWQRVVCKQHINIPEEILPVYLTPVVILVVSCLFKSITWHHSFIEPICHLLDLGHNRDTLETWEHSCILLHHYASLWNGVVCINKQGVQIIYRQSIMVYH